MSPALRLEMRLLWESFRDFYECGGSSGYVTVVGFTADLDYNAVYVSRGSAPAGGPHPNDVWMVDPKFVNFAVEISSTVRLAAY